MSGSGNLIKYSGHNYFRQRLILSLLSGKTVKIDKIRSDDDNPGLRDYEVSFLRLLEKVTNGSIIEISYTGTSVLYKPGIITGGKVFHECHVTRGIGYYLEPMIALAPFSKNPFNLTLTGITNENTDVDLIRTVILQQLKRFGIEEGLELKISKRGSPPLGGGEVNFQCPIVRSLKPLQFIDEGRIKRIRGIASPGFALSLVAESTTGALVSSETAANPGDTPEDIGKRTAQLLLSEIRKGGCVDSISQWLVLLLMVLGPEDVSKVKIGKLSAFS
ncbi:2357_t:CDS:2 [Paraglomus occultum]|uniref:2357_t:CDS:1 n=1 Tax=Paraglomus occultum TaxID=144539 RepID=A0A9N8ZA88_9GLOM|nr:2357_t:CDS:2 [Paraglomus occultum]